MQMMKLCVRLPACVVSCQTRPQDCMRQRDGKPVSVQRINNATGGVEERKTVVPEIYGMSRAADLSQLVTANNFERIYNDFF